jgi:hypothetical protein
LICERPDQKSDAARGGDAGRYQRDFLSCRQSGRLRHRRLGYRRLWHGRLWHGRLWHGRLRHGLIGDLIERRDRDCVNGKDRGTEWARVGRDLWRQDCEVFEHQQRRGTNVVVDYLGKILDNDLRTVTIERFNFGGVVEERWP